MQFVSYYESPIGRILMASDDIGLFGLWMEGQRYYAIHFSGEYEERETDVLRETKKWLDTYFERKDPGVPPPLHIIGSRFYEAVSEAMLTIPYGKTMTYGEIAEILTQKTGKRASARAVGGAVGHNEISIIVPCHRVVGKGGNLTGYGGGMERKIWLLESEGIDLSSFYLPKKGIFASRLDIVPSELQNRHND